MSGYILGVVGAALAIGVAECLIPETAKTRTYLKLLFSLCLLLTVIKPLGSLASGLPEFIDGLLYNDEDEEIRYLEIADGELSEAYREGISKLLSEEFSLSDFSVGVKMGDDRNIETVTVTLMGRDIFKNPRLIENCVMEAVGAECIVIVG